MAKHIVILFSLMLASCLSMNAQKVINLNDEGDGKYTIEASLNGVGVRTFYVAESWFASVSPTTYNFLYENDYIRDADIKGMTVLKMPDGTSSKAGSFVIRSLRIGNIIVKDLPAFVIKKQTAPLLIGNSAFDCFGVVSQDGTKLIIDDRDEAFEGVEIAQENGAEDEVTSLKTLAQKYVDERDYENAAACFEQLEARGELNPFTEYQYIVVLNVLEKNDKTLNMSKAWLAENEGKSLTMDYWIYDGLGDCYSRMKQTDLAIENYTKAVEVYCEMFGTTEKGIQKSLFKDETLGYTLYDLGRLYATKKNLRQAEYYCALAAKCGNAPAKEFCDKYHVKY